MPSKMINGLNYDPPRTATLVVAASNASAAEKAQADYVCDGTADDVEIQAAIVALPATGGKLQLSSGTFTLAASILIQDKMVWLSGEGTGWAMVTGVAVPMAGGTIITAANAFNSDFISVKSSTGAAATVGLVAGTKITHLKIFQNYPVASPNAHGIHQYGTAEGDAGHQQNQLYIDNVVVSGVGGTGFKLGGGESFVTNSFALGAYYYGFWGGEDSVWINLIATGNARHGGEANITLLSANQSSNLYSYESHYNGIEIIANNGKTTISSTFSVSNARLGYSLDGTGITLNGFTAENNGTNAALGDDERTNVYVHSTATRVANGYVIGDTIPTSGIDSQFGIVVLDDGVIIESVTVEKHNLVGIDIRANYATVIGSTVRDSAQAALFFPEILLRGASQHSVIKGNILRATTANIPQSAILEDAGVDYTAIEGNNIEGAYTVERIVRVGAHSIVEGNIGYIAHGESRSASGTLTAGNANAIFFAWHDPELQDIFVKKVVIEITTPGGTALSVGQVGIADDAAGTNIGTEFFPAAGIDLNAAAIRDSWNAGDTGVQTKFVFCQDSASATDGWVVGKILAQNAAALAGRWYVEYVGR